MKKHTGTIGDDLTTERLSNRFTSMFDLVKYAKTLAENVVEAGRVPEKENLANKLLRDIAAHKEKVVDVKKQDEPNSHEMDALREKLLAKEPEAEEELAAQ